MTWKGSSMRLKNLDLIIAMTIVALNVLWVVLGIQNVLVGSILALPLVLFLPGYTLTEILSHGKSLYPVYKFILSLGLSLAIDILSGFILNILPTGLRAISWAVFLGLLTLVFSLLIVYFRRRYLRQERYFLTFRFRIHDYVLTGLAILIAILSVQYSAVSANQQPYPGFTQLWLLPPTQTTATCTLHLGVRSFESTSVTYRIVLRENSAQVQTWSSVMLAPQEQWNRDVPISSSLTGSTYVEVSLYKANIPKQVYREVHVTVRVSKRDKDQKMQCVS